MPGTHVALIRGINVGRAKRVAMADLRSLFTSLGYREVKTLLNSGNVVFSARGDPAARIEKALTARLRVSARVVVLTAAELGAVIDGNPLVDIASNPSRLLVAVLAKPGDRSRVAPLWCPGGIARSRLTEAVGRALGDSVTTRNWATITKLQALVTRP